MKHKELLKTHGFIKIGYWKYKPETAFNIESLLNDNSECGIYAFVSNEVVKYIGKTKRTLSKRMDDYKRMRKSGIKGKNIKPKTEEGINEYLKTHKKPILRDVFNHNAIRNLLENNQEVDIYFFKINNEYNLDITEQSYLELFNPIWNKRGKDRKD